MGFGNLFHKKLNLWIYRAREKSEMNLFKNYLHSGDH
jgi:hypothetical protein